MSTMTAMSVPNAVHHLGKTLDAVLVCLPLKRQLRGLRCQGLWQWAVGSYQECPRPTLLCNWSFSLPSIPPTKDNDGGCNKHTFMLKKEFIQFKSKKGFRPVELWEVQLIRQHCASSKVQPEGQDKISEMP